MREIIVKANATIHIKSENGQLDKEVIERLACLVKHGVYHCHSSTLR